MTDLERAFFRPGEAAIGKVAVRWSESSFVT